MVFFVLYLVKDEINGTEPMDEDESEDEGLEEVRGEYTLVVSCPSCPSLTHLYSDDKVHSPFYATWNLLVMYFIDTFQKTWNILSVKYCSYVL